MSETGLKACVYPLDIRADDQVWVASPEDGKHWELVELRPVSEGAIKKKLISIITCFMVEAEFADPPPLQPSSVNDENPVEQEQEGLIPAEHTPTTLVEWAVLILNTPQPDLKVRRVIFNFKSPAD